MTNTAESICPYVFLMRMCVFRDKNKKKGRTEDALALAGEEGRDKLRKAAGRCK